MTASRAGSLAAVLALALTGLAPSASAADASCRVKNTTQSISYASSDGSALHDAIDDAGPGDDLRVRGTCVGNYVIGQDLSLRKQRRQNRPVLDGADAGTVLAVRSGAAVVLARLVLTNGADSALIIEEGARVRLSDGSIRASWSPTNGGLIRNHGRLVVRGSVAELGGAAHFGGAIFNDGVLRADRVELRSNAANANGGGLANYAGRARVRESVIVDNWASGTGGGIFSTERLTVRDTVLEGNEPNDCTGC